MATPLQHKIFTDISPFLPDMPNPLPDNCDLIGLGLDSLAMMKLAAMWRRQGHDVSFARLIEQPRLDAWLEMLTQPTRHVSQPVSSPLLDLHENDPFPLALMQHAYWVGRDDSQHLGGVAAHFYHEFDLPQIDAARLENAVQQLLSRHGMLRVTVLEEGQQQVMAQARWPGLKTYDLRHETGETARLRLEAIRAALSHRQLNIEQGEVFDVRLTYQPEALGGGCRLHFNLDMIAADAMSLRVLLDDLATLYLEPEQPLAPLDLSFRQYQQLRHAWLQEPQQQARYAQDKQWWLSRLADLPGAPMLPSVGMNTHSTHQTVVRRHRWFDAHARQQLEARAREHQLTLPMMIAAAFAEVLTQFSDEEDFILNLPLFNRESLHASVSALVGDFTSSVLLAWQGSQPGSFLERAQRLQQQFRQDAAHAFFSGVEVLREAARVRGQQQFAPVVFTSALGLGELFSERVQQAFGQPGWIVSQGPQVWLDAQVTELNHGILVNWDAREASFPAGMLDLMFDQFIGLLEALIASEQAWQQPVRSALPPAQQAVRQRANATDAPLPESCLHSAFFHLAQQNPEAPALFGAHQTLTYGEVAERARRLATHLHNLGVQPGEPVAIALPKGPEQIIAVLGVLASGAAWLPLNHQQPEQRIKAILQNAGVKQVITQLPDEDSLLPLAEVVYGDPQHLAYVIYTSGSTGTPKGVEISHLAAKNTIDDLNRRYPLRDRMRTLAVSALSFDLAVYDIFAPLSVGGAVVCIEDDSWRDAQRWVALIRQHQVSVLNCVPAIAEMTFTSAAADNLTLPLRIVLLGGDWVPLDLPKKLRAVADQCRCIALGGTTETAIHSTVQEITTVPADWRSVPYGYPLDNVRCRVVDSLGRDRCDWVSGELWIGGAGVALGYRHDPQRTADRFVQQNGERWYRTGDLARYHASGSLEFLGRRDHQVKVRGYRIELGEIESALIAHSGVARGIVLLDDEQHLVAAYTSKQPVDDAALRQHLQRYLPQEMVPERLVALPALPLSSNGKIDRSLLRQWLAEQAPQAEHPGEAALPGVEQQVANIWHDIVGKHPHRQDNFFTAGGDSLLATRLVAALRREGFSDVTLSQLVAQPVLAAFCQTLHRKQPTTAASAIAHDRSGRYAAFPLTSVQQAYLFGRESEFALGGIGCTFYREFEVNDLDLARLENAVNQLIARHDMLRAVFSEGQQQVQPQVAHYQIPRFCQPGEDNVGLQRAEYASHSFDPQHWPLFSVSVAQQGGTHRVAIAIDNLILDALSILLFYQELDALYHQRPLPDAPAIQFRDALLARQPQQAQRDAAWAWWRPRLDHLPLAPQLPLAQQPEAIAVPEFTRREQWLDAKCWQQLTQKARQNGVTPSAVMLNAFATVLRRWSHQPDFTLNLTLFDRPEGHADIARVMGDFTSLVLVPCRHADGGWLDEVRQVQRDMWGALDHRSLSAVEVLRELARRHQEPELVMPVVFTSALGLSAEPEQGIFSQATYGLSQTPQVWLDHQLTEQAGGVSLVWDAVEALFPAGMLDAMFSAYQQLIQHLCHHSWQQPLPELLPVAQRQVREAITAAAHQPCVAETLHHAFFQQAEQAPQQVALIWQQDQQTCQFSYAELAQQALKLAHWLQLQGTAVGDRVAISLPKGPQQVIAVLGVLAAGASWVPIGIDQPLARKQTILQRADVSLVLDLNTPLAGAQAVQADVAPLAHPVAISPQQLAYVIFTSGSTGEPKGVEMCHAATHNTLQDLRQRLAMQPQDRILALSALDFDLSVFDLFAPLGCGAALVMVDEAYRRDAAHWLHLMHRHDVTLWNSVPALLEMLLTAAQDASLPVLRAALISGDWIALTLPERLQHTAPACRLLALGGATEAAIWSNIFPVTTLQPAWRSIPYGYPLRNQRWRVINHTNADCPDWVEGELLIGGTGLARGYLGDASLTEARFPILDGERWYRTGDRGRYWPDGTLEFLGRLDTQMKLRGHRIEAGEVEQALLTLSGVDQAVVSLWHDGLTQRLVAAVAPHTPARTEQEEVFSPGNTQRGLLEYEASMAEHMLAELLQLPEQTGGVWHEQPLQPDEKGSQVLQLWLKWLVSRGVLQPQDSHYIATGTAAIFARPAAAQVVEARTRYASWRAMLRGEQDNTALLTDNVFSPASLSAADDETRQWLSQLALHINSLHHQRGQPISIVEINGASGQHSAALLARLPQGSVHYTLLESSPLALEQARTQLANSGHQIDFLLLNELYVPEALQNSADIVLAANALHRYAQPLHGLTAAAQLLTPTGELWMMERQSLTPVAMISAGLLAGGYGDSGNDPLRTVGVWQQRAQASGFTVGECHHSGLAATLTLRASHRQALPENWSSQLAEKLPKAMVPERLVLLTHLPLTANGKVDRKRLQSLYDNLPKPQQQQETLTTTEAKLAQLWGTLLATAPHFGRQQGFFESGGDSLLATRLINAIREAFNVDLALRKIFTAPSLAAMAAEIEAQQAEVASMEGGEL
ncbi:non-ribosomal peptide synthetase [Candidatus Pantoea multigeneris]|uniref:Amino acid adenylation domain-containing protein n=1 Tax=Candidatus Pantoea multigeneris TaxID=2608357 RepID=A0ABX0R8D4_9GAMM|nr:non-ribosomal peptide synthetase [Pantoea multigeneris]NIF21637.1 amino acid adenylation domain-containing protein [Pantoea multigeneris]